MAIAINDAKVKEALKAGEQFDERFERLAADIDALPKDSTVASILNALQKRDGHLGGTASIEINLGNGYSISVRNNAERSLYFRETSESERYGVRDPDYHVPVKNIKELLGQLRVDTGEKIEQLEKKIAKQIEDTAETLAK